MLSCNVSAFMIAYASYIVKWEQGWFDDRIFTLDAPTSVYEEISGLAEEFIEIIN